MVVGGLVSFIVFLRDAAVAGEKNAESYDRLRRNLGRCILLGLEVLIVADIVRTIVVDPTFQSVTVLGIIVLIRIVLSFSLEMEIDGTWPWDRGESKWEAQHGRRLARGRLDESDASDSTQDVIHVVIRGGPRAEAAPGARCFQESGRKTRDRFGAGPASRPHQGRGDEAGVVHTDSQSRRSPSEQHEQRDRRPVRPVARCGGRHGRRRLRDRSNRESAYDGSAASQLRRCIGRCCDGQAPVSLPERTVSVPACLLIMHLAAVCCSTESTCLQAGSVCCRSVQRTRVDFY